MSVSDLPDHVATTVEVLADVRAKHEGEASRVDRIAGRLTSVLGRSTTVVALVCGIGAWMSANRYLDHAHKAIDPPPFAALELAATLAALFLAALILATQRRDDMLSDKRAQLTLQSALLNDQKSSKIIQLIEELRRDLPTVANRPDEVANAMIEPPDPQDVLATVDDQRS